MTPAQLLAPWHTLPIMVWDVETTGVDPTADAIVQVGCALFVGGELAGSACSLVNPGRPIPAESTAIHGITDDMVKDAPLPPAALLAVANAADPGEVGLIGCAYNAPFDFAFLNRGWDVMLVESDLPWLDPLVMVRVADKFEKGKGRHKLEAACKRRGIELSGAHNAQADAIATGALLFSFRKTLGDLTICEVLRRQENHRVSQEREFEEWRANQPPMEAAP